MQQMQHGRDAEKRCILALTWVAFRLALPLKLSLEKETKTGDQPRHGVGCEWPCALWMPSVGCVSCCIIASTDIHTWILTPGLPSRGPGKPGRFQPRVGRHSSMLRIMIPGRAGTETTVPLQSSPPVVFSSRTRELDSGGYRPTPNERRRQAGWSHVLPAARLTLHHGVRVGEKLGSLGRHGTLVGETS